MWIILLDIVGAILGMALGAALGLLVKNRLRKTKRGGAVTFAASLLMAFAFIQPRPPSTIERESEDLKMRKGGNPGDQSKTD